LVGRSGWGWLAGAGYADRNAVIVALRVCFQAVRTREPLFTLKQPYVYGFTADSEFSVHKPINYGQNALIRDLLSALSGKSCL
jgi:hypothetical protein